MKVEISYNGENDEIFFTEIRRKHINLDSFFSEKLYAKKKERAEFRIARTYLIVDFPNVKFEDFKRWLCDEKSKRLVELLKEVCRHIEKLEEVV